MTDGLDGVVAVVLTYRRPRLATEVVRGLVDREGFPPEDVILVVNGEGGLDDHALEAAVDVVRLPHNVGPAGGFRAGLEAAADRGARWAYLCEDDVGLFDLPTPRVADLVTRVEATDPDARIGGVVAYGRTMDRRTGRTVPHVPEDPDADPLPDTDVAAWGASLVRCDVARAGVLPDPALFFGFEDFDFWLALRRSGWRLTLDARTAAAVADRVFHERRHATLAGRRPTDAEEPWRKYYEARNFLVLRRRYGTGSWTRNHLAMTVRRAQLAGTWAHARAALHGLIDGLRGRSGPHTRYQRGAGERDGRAGLRVLHVVTDNDRRGGQVFAADLHGALERRGVTTRVVALAPATHGDGLDFPVLGPSRRSLTTLRNLRREARANDVVVGHGSTTLPLCALARIGTGVPFVYRQISDQLFWADTRARRLRVRLALRAATHVTALWEGAADVLVERFGVPRDRVTVVPNGVPADRCPPADETASAKARARFGLDPARTTLLSIGALVPEKGVDTVVRAMADERARDWQLLVVGAGPDRAALERLAAGIGDRTVVFADPVASGAEAISAADVVLLTSRGGDSMPAVLIEAGMMGLPTVATPVEGIVDIVQPGRTGELVADDDPAAIAAAAARCVDRADAYGTAARQWCLERFEIDVVAARWHQVLGAVAHREIAGR